MLKILAEQGLLNGKTISIDGTTLGANAALRSIVHGGTCEAYNDFLKKLAAEIGIERPRASNWQSWTQATAKGLQRRVGKPGRSGLARREDVGRTHPSAIKLNMRWIWRRASGGRNVCSEVSVEGSAELVLDKGFHSNEVLRRLKEWKVRSYRSEPNRGRRRWSDEEAEQLAVYGSRRRIRGGRGKRLLRQRGEKVERSFAHMYETGTMRRTHLRRHPDILKRLLIDTAAFNLPLLMRSIEGCGTPRQLRCPGALVVASVS